MIDFSFIKSIPISHAKTDTIIANSKISMPMQLQSTMVMEDGKL